MSKSSRMNIIVAACEGMGIGKDNTLPWSIRADLKYFAKMTSEVTSAEEVTPQGQGSPKVMNAVIMGRKTWESIPAKFRPLKNRLNVILTRGEANPGEGCENTLTFPSLEVSSVRGHVITSILWNVQGCQ